jgi:hypothetical protein
VFLTATSHTGTTTLAAVSLHHDFWQKVLALWVMTPSAIEWTAFKKNGSPDARTIVNGKALYVEDDSLLHIIAPS